MHSKSFQTLLSKGDFEGGLVLPVGDILLAIEAVSLDELEKKFFGLLGVCCWVCWAAAARRISSTGALK